MNAESCLLCSCVVIQTVHPGYAGERTILLSINVIEVFWIACYREVKEVMEFANAEMIVGKRILTRGATANQISQWTPALLSFAA